MAATEPLFDRPLGSALFQRPEGAVTAGAFLRDVLGLAAALPAGAFIVNACRERYQFAVAFAAALVAGRTSLLNGEIGALRSAYPDCGVVDDAMVAAAAPLAGTDVPQIDCDHLAAIVLTSGSTGAAVAHPKRWGGLVARSRAAATAFAMVEGSILGTVPPQHMYGLELTVLQPLHAPVCSWCGPFFFPGDVAAAAAACPAPCLLVTTPLQLRALLHGGVPLPVSGVVSATAQLDPALAAQAEAAWSVPVREIFGATECGSIASRRTTSGPDWAVYPGIAITFGEEGTVVEAPGVDAVALSDLFEPAQGGFRLLGRRTDVVKLGGRRASLPGLNQVLTGLDGVEDGAFVVPDDLDERSTARLLAVVVAPGRTGAAILADLRLVLDPVFLPRRVIQVDRLPRNAMGKLPRLEMLDLVARAGAA